MNSTWTFNQDRDRVIEATDLVGLIGEHVPLTRKGREHVGLCPFHDDSRPSMHVVTHKGNAFYKCFACGASGTAIDFVMHYHKKDFLEALQFLADRAGIALSRGSSDSAPSGGGSTRSVLRNICKLAGQYFQAMLEHPQQGERYHAILRQRGVSDAMRASFQIGAAPQGWNNLITWMRGKNITTQQLIDAGLAKQTSDGQRTYDAFRDRIIFPICDESGSPISFGGRKVDPEDEPKYLNGPETAIFDKSGTLYGLNLARRAIIDANHVVVTEGYTDVIACHQAGITNVVGTLGTALTDRHATLLSRLCDTVVLLFDGDEAGQRAADRAVSTFFLAPVDVKICVLPGGQDPDDLLRADGGRDSLCRAIADAEDALIYKVSRLQHELDAISSISGQQKRVDGFLDELGRLGFASLTGLRKGRALSMLSSRLGLPIADLERAIPHVRQRTNAAGVGHQATTDSPLIETNASTAGALRGALQRAQRIAEHDLLAVLLYDPHLAIDAAGDDGLDVSVEQFADAGSQAIARGVLEFITKGESFTMQMLLDALEDDAHRQLAAKLYFDGQVAMESSPDGPEELLNRAIEGLHRCAAQQSYRRASQQAASEQTSDDDQLARAVDLINRRRAHGNITDAIARNT